MKLLHPSYAMQFKTMPGFPITPNYRLRVFYTVNVRIQMLHGGFMNTRIASHAGLIMNHGEGMEEPAIKSALESMLGKKLRIRRFRWEAISILEAHEID